jgi:hypothetical protein
VQTTLGAIRQNTEPVVIPDQRQLDYATVYLRALSVEKSCST